MSAFVCLAVLSTMTVQEETEPIELEKTVPPVGTEPVGARYRLWIGNLGGTVRSDKAAVAGTNVRLNTDLDIDQNEVFHDLSLWISLGDIGNLRAGWWFGGFEGKETLDATVRFGGKSFSGGTPVESEVDIHVGSLTYEYPIFPASELGDQAQILVQGGLRVLHTSAEIRSQNDEAKGTVDGLLPVLGARGELWLWEIVRTELEVSGLFLPLGDREIRLLDVAFEVGVAPWQGAFAALGYHIVSSFTKDEGGEEKSETDLLLQGLTFSVGWRF